MTTNNNLILSSEEVAERIVSDFEYDFRGDRDALKKAISQTLEANTKSLRERVQELEGALRTLGNESTLIAEGVLLPTGEYVMVPDFINAALSGTPSPENFTEREISGVKQPETAQNVPSGKFDSKDEVVKAAVEFGDALSMYLSYIVSPQPDDVSKRLQEAQNALFKALEAYQAEKGEGC